MLVDNSLYLNMWYILCYNWTPIKIYAYDNGEFYLEVHSTNVSIYF